MLYSIETSSSGNGGALAPPNLSSLVRHRRRLQLPTDRAAITEVWAAAGAGKSTLLAGWAEQLRADGEIIVWVGLGGPTTTARSLPALVAASHRLAVDDSRPPSDPERGDGVVPETPASAAEALVPLLSDSRPTTILLDDVHHLGGRADAEWLTRFISARPAHVRIVLAGRYAPASLARIALVPGIVEFRSTDLAFTRDEVAAFLAVRSITLSDDDLDLMTRRTEGWAAALSLLAGWLQNLDGEARLPEQFLDDHRAIGDYLVNEVLDQLDEDRRRFLLVTSVVDSLSVPLAVHLTGREDAGDILDSLEQQTALVSHTGTGSAEYSYHATLHGYLRAELRRRDFGAMHRAARDAADWYRLSGRPDLALELALAADSVDDLLDVVDAEGVGLVFAGKGALVQHALDRLEISGRQSTTTHVLAVLDSAPYLPDPERADLHLAAASVRIEEAPPLVRVLHTALTIMRAADEALRAGREPATADDTAEPVSVPFVDATVLTALDERLADAAGDPNGCDALLIDVALFCALARARVQRVTSDEAELETLRSAVSSAAASHRTWLQLVLLDAAATAAARTGRWSEAIDDQDRMAVFPQTEALGDIVSGRIQFAIAAAAFVRCRPFDFREVDDILASDGAHIDPGIGVPAEALRLLVALDGDTGVGARERFDELDNLLNSRGHEHPRTVAACSQRYVELALRLHDRHRAVGVVELVSAILGRDSLEAVTGSALLSNAAGRQTHAETVLLSALEGGSRAWHSSGPVFAWLTLAAWAERNGRDTIADGRVLRALEAAERLEMRRPFIALQGTGVALLEPRLGRLGVLESFAESIIAAAGRILPADVVRRQQDTADFTPKEREILRELPRHQSVGDIALKQHLSPNTVKTHMRSIYQKLGATGRAEAVERAMSQGLL